jgi:hypothetical protein
MLEGARRHVEELRDHGDSQLTDHQKERVNSLLDESDSVRVFVQKSIIQIATEDVR